jgi:hypothetical protein
MWKRFVKDLKKALRITKHEDTPSHSFSGAEMAGQTLIKPYIVCHGK